MKVLRRNGICCFVLFLMGSGYSLTSYYVTRDIFFSGIFLVFLILAGFIALKKWHLDLFMPSSLLMAGVAVEYGYNAFNYGYIGLEFAGESQAAFHAIGYVLIFLVFILIGYRLPIGSVVAWMLPVPALEWSAKKVKATYVFLIGGMFLLWFYLLSETGMAFSDAFSRTMVLRYSIMEEGLFYVQLLTIWFAFTPFFLLFILSIQQQKSFTQKLLWLHFIGLSIWSLGFGARSVLIQLVLGLAIIWNFATKNKVDLLRAAPVGLVLVLFVGTYSIFREISLKEPVTIASLSMAVRSFDFQEILDMGLGRLGSGSFRNFVEIVDVYPLEELLYGKTFVYAIGRPIPNFMWEFVNIQKPLPSNDYLKLMLHPEWTWKGISYGVVSELYINFHWVGILFGGIIVGITLKALDEYVMSNSANPNMLLGYAFLAMIAPHLILEGVNNPAFGMLVGYLGLFWIVTRVISQNRDSSTISDCLRHAPAVSRGLSCDEFAKRRS